jgi:hypothetical protein
LFRIAINVSQEASSSLTLDVAVEGIKRHIQRLFAHSFIICCAVAQFNVEWVMDAFNDAGRFSGVGQSKTP